jgi:pimeloyl-ACP methyl ester carboxylesterase
MERKPVIIIPGLGNRVGLHQRAVKGWRKHGLITNIFPARWIEEEIGFREKFDRLVKMVDRWHDKYGDITIIGNSAGSSLGLNLLGACPDKISHLIINCGRIRQGDWPWLTFKKACINSPSFYQSVVKAEELEKSLTQSNRSKILTLRPRFDEVVPFWTVPITGAKNEIIPTIGHAWTIALNMTINRGCIFNFIRH